MAEDDVQITAEDRAFFSNNRASFLDELSLPQPKQWINPRKAKRKRELDKIQDAEAIYEKQARSRKPSETERVEAADSGRGLAAKVGGMPIKMPGNRLGLAPKRPTAKVAPTAGALKAQALSAAKKPKRDKGKGAAKPGTSDSEAGESDGSGDDALDDALDDDGGAGAAAEMDAEEDEEDEDNESADPAALWAQREKLLELKRMEIASYASDILASPPKSAGKIRALRELCSFRKPGIGYTVCKLAIMSMATVFKDILPGYRIRERTAKEKEVTVTKEVKELREFEESLLRNYQMYLKRLHALIKNEGLARKKLEKSLNPNADLKQAATLCSTCIKALCFLLIEVPHFNFRSNIVELIVPRMNDRKNLKMADHCCLTVTRLFKDDIAFDATQEVIKAMSRVIKAANYNVRERMIKCFFDLKLNESLIKAYQQQQAEEKERAAKGAKYGVGGKLGKHKSRMKKKEEKEHKALDKELREAQVEIDQKALGRRQTTILSQIFATYFRVLKHGRRSPILSICLQGIAKHAHLIDASFFGDLMAVLREIMAEDLGSRVTLQTVRTGCMLLGGQAGMAMNIDVKAFHDALYSEMINVTDDDDGVSLAMICVRLLLHERREVSLERVAAFLKRLAQTGLQLRKHNQTVTALSNIRSMMVKYPKLETMLDADTMTQSTYRPDVREPEHSNPMATPLWELVMLSKHYFPWVQSFGQHIAYGAPSTGSNALPPKFARAQPHHLYKNLDPAQHGFCFNPPIKPPKSHPLAKNLPDTGYRHSAHIMDPGMGAEIAAKVKAAASDPAAVESAGMRRFVSNIRRDRAYATNERLGARLEALEMVVDRFKAERKKNALKDGGSVKKKKKKKPATGETTGETAAAPGAAGKGTQKKKTKKKKKAVVVAE